MSRGMQRNVATSLGYSGDKRGPESVRCATCGTPMEFNTDGPCGIGRVSERCPRGCATRMLTPNGDPFEHQRTSKLIEAAKAEAARTSKESYARRDYGRDVCRRKACAKEFTKKSPSQAYCSQSCSSHDQAGRRSK